MNLTGNKLTGYIPGSFRKLTNLGYLELANNQLTQEKNVTLQLPKKEFLYLDVERNFFTFDGLESVDKKYPQAQYDNQAAITIHQQGNVLSVYAGGTLSNNTYHWFKTGAADSTTITGDSTFTPPSSGSYYAKVTNAVATGLTLYTDTSNFTINNFTAGNHLAANIDNIKQNLQVYPSHAAGIVHIQINGTATFTFTNSDGRVLLT